MSAADRATLDVTGAPGAARGLTRREVWANLSTASATLAVIHSTVVLMPLVNPNPALAIWLQLYRDRSADGGAELYWRGPAARIRLSGAVWGLSSTGSASRLRSGRWARPMWWRRSSYWRSRQRHELTLARGQERDGDAGEPMTGATSSDADAMIAELERHFGRLVRPREPLARHSTFGVGGVADAWVVVKHEPQLVALVELALAHSWPVMLVGNGTNVLYADAGMRGIVAQMALTTWDLREHADGSVLLAAGAGVSLPKLVNDLAERGLAGLEWGAGVPGTIGGAIVSNAGAHGLSTADTLRGARVLFAPVPGKNEAQGVGDDARAARVVVRELDAADLELEYRHSRFRAARRITFDDDGRPAAPPRAMIEPAEMILAGTFALRRDAVADVKARVASYRRHRKATQPPQKSAGSVFKNPPGDHAGRLIQSVGLMGARAGGAEISPMHANFIVNTGGATAADVVALIALARRMVREATGVRLELEVELRGAW